MKNTVNVELFPCSGGMAEGFRRAGVTFDFAFEYEEDHCASYEANLGHRPVRMDVRELLAMIQGGWRVNIGLLVADPPCTPWSRAGKREGIADERDMLVDTCEIIRLLRPSTYLIGNVPGLDDSVNWHIVQKVIGSLEKDGYCVADFAALDAADYGVPQHRIRPFWFGHLAGPCLRFPAPTHGDPKLLHTLTLPGITPLIPWVTCKQALGHLEGDELGRPVRLRKRGQHSDQHGSVPERPARDTHGDGSILINERDAPAPTVGAKQRGQASQVLIVTSKHPTIAEDEPSTTIRGGGAGHSAPQVVLATGKKRRESRTERVAPMDQPSPTITRMSKTPMDDERKIVLKPEGDVAPATGRRKTPRVPQSKRVSDADKPATTVQSRGDRVGSGMMISDLNVEMHHPPSYHHDEPAKTIRAGDGQGANRALVLDGSAPTRRRGTGSSTQGMQSSRVRSADRPSSVVTCDTERATDNNVKLEWPWPRPATTVHEDPRIPPPGHHEEGQHMNEGAVILSERAAAILQGFPDGECVGHVNPLDDKIMLGGVRPGEVCPVCKEIRRWHFIGATKKARWSQIGQAMPTGLAHPVAAAVVEQRAATPHASM